MTNIIKNALLITMTAIACGVYLADSLVQKTSATTEVVKFSNDTFTSTPPEPTPAIDEPQPSPVPDVKMAESAPIAIDPPAVAIVIDPPEVKPQPAQVECSNGVCSVRSSGQESERLVRRFRIFRRR